MLLCPICKRPMDPNIVGCTRCSSPKSLRVKPPETIMRDAIIQAACATLRQQGVPDTYVAERAHERLPYAALEELTMGCLNHVRVAVGCAPLAIGDYDGGAYLERLR